MLFITSIACFSLLSAIHAAPIYTTEPGNISRATISSGPNDASRKWEVLKPGTGFANSQAATQAADIKSRMITIKGGIPKEHLDIWNVEHTQPLDKQKLDALRFKDLRSHRDYNQLDNSYHALGGELFAYEPQYPYTGVNKPKPTL